MKAQVVYTEANVTQEWLRHIAAQPGESWVEIRDGGLVLVHEFEDLRRQDEQEVQCLQT